ncbi:MAG: hypothetical protein FJW63_01820 [Actinobacteria bacterium]|nr:hypothetical protein [Actinomycetota bacterium]
MKKLFVVIVALLMGSFAFAQPELGNVERKTKRIKEVKTVETEYTEGRIDEAISNLTRQIDELTAERAVWEKRKEKVASEGY